MHRLLSSLLVALALLISPIAMAGGAAANAAGVPAQAMSARSAHCAGDDLPSDEGQQAKHLSCSAACAALPAVFPQGGAAPRREGTRILPPGARAMIGFTAEGETPPPRIAPVI